MKRWKKLDQDEKLERMWFLFRVMAVVLLIRGLLEIIQIVGYAFVMGLYEPFVF